MKPITRAYIDVDSKKGLAPFSRHLVKHGIKIICPQTMVSEFGSRGVQVTAVKMVYSSPLLQTTNGKRSPCQSALQGEKPNRLFSVDEMFCFNVGGVEQIGLVVVNLPLPCKVSRPQLGDQSTEVERTRLALLTAATYESGVIVIYDPFQYRSFVKKLEWRGLDHQADAAYLCELRQSALGFLAAFTAQRAQACAAATETSDDE
ncbi:hypothetical protein COT78_04210 [Candidatus Berkelbacteria bacterium CG10_big_fil_rev_8_21_14_0_10_43_13]|uniref:Uncharacterized protein n=1 Tax=Candidatus Berkelbacteria bacterium CG10_big_fil_rev_8_21_14_0_10_43_13 TaxID=1974514 RepID=A0A2H0W5H9_9BACT|nr:MAG: hypothetical protein COT78_04210 [Candidatus Berkelbacteria bacterium CG10_big_fil_rev_8_21_14_0_10_43_13]